MFVPFTNIAWTNLGYSLSGNSGAPILGARGPLMANSTLVLSLANAAAISPCWLVAGGNAANWPIVGGTFVPSLDIVIPATTSPQGSLALSTIWPFGVPAGFPLHLQFAIADPTAPQAFALSNALLGVVP